ncbi:MAG: pantoate--beta-alanine ligase [Actinomycetota bacterium]|nr:pantoate--beta-alanine ligase [Actinomycetota bacterium]
MKAVRTVAELRTFLEGAGRVGLVPTMGALHEGHLSLVRRAREECETVLVSLFVNPSQFGPGEDLEAYPRDETRDAALLEAEGADVLFAPALEEVYPPGFATSVCVGGITRALEGGARGAEHFDGVATVVLKLLNMARPDAAYFGQKDAQQTLVIRRMVRDLDVPTRIEVLPTVRDPDGLALSSRNAYLEPAERDRALGLSAALRAAEDTVARGELSGAAVLEAARARLAAAGLEAEYLELRSAEDLTPVESVNGSTLLAVAARVGRARLIDNVVLADGAQAGRWPAEHRPLDDLADGAHAGPAPGEHRPVDDLTGGKA